MTWVVSFSGNLEAQYLENNTGAQSPSPAPTNSREPCCQQHFWACAHSSCMQPLRQHVTLSHPASSLQKSAAGTAQLTLVWGAGPRHTTTTQGTSPPSSQLCLLQSSAPGAAPWSPQVTACCLPCTAVNPIGSSFPIQMPSN